MAAPNKPPAPSAHEPASAPANRLLWSLWRFLALDGWLWLPGGLVGPPDTTGDRPVNAEHPLKPR